MKKLTFDDIKNIVSTHAARNETYIELYKKFFMRVMDRQLELDKKKQTRWMANISSPITYMICMAIYWMYQDSKVAFEVYRVIKKAKWEEITDEESKDAEITSNALISMFENIYDKCDGSDEFDKCVLDAIVLGNWFGWVWYEKTEDTYEVIWENWKKEVIEEKISLPNIYRIIPLNFFTELSANGLQKAQYNVVRKVKTAARINEDYKIYGKTYVEHKDDPQEILIEKDWNMVFRFMIFNNMPWVCTVQSLNLWNTYWGKYEWTREQWQMHTDIFTDNSYKIGWELHEVYEVHTDKTMQVFIDWKDFGTFARLWPRKEKPFFKLSFRDWLNGLYDIWAWMLCYPYHKTADAFLNMRIDNDRLAWTQPLIVNSDETEFEWTDVMEWYPWKVVKVRDVNASVKELWITWAWAWAASNEVQALWQTVQEAVWVSWYKLWVQQKVERSATWVEELIQSADAAMKSFIGSVAKAKWFIAKYIVILALYYMDDETLEKMSWMSGLKANLDLTDFINDYTFKFDISSVSSLRERQEVEDLVSFLRDYQWATRPDWTPLINSDVAVKELIAKKRLNTDLYLTPEEAKEFMQEQIANNGQMNQQNLAENPMAWMEEWIVPEQAAVSEDIAMWMVWTPWVQAGSQWSATARVTNPLWINQVSWEE